MLIVAIFKTIHASFIGTQHEVFNAFIVNDTRFPNTLCCRAFQLAITNAGHWVVRIFQ
ncbi:Uncharacterised protein [Vibrio cholerae]|nr:Uncharacterised protein [Vibrio cholerae]CSD10446.1 Uncharacterised protein [Vibrio cholerae]